MHANGLHKYWAAVLVVARVVNELAVERVIQPTPRMNGVVALEDVLARVVQLAVSQQKAQAAQLQILLMIALNGVGDEGEAEFVVRTVWQAEEAIRKRIVAAELDGLIDLGVCEAFMLAFIPAEASKGAQVARQLLIEVQSEAVLHCAEGLMLGDVGRCICAGEVCLYGVAIEAHVGMVHIAQHTRGSFALGRSK